MKCKHCKKEVDIKTLNKSLSKKEMLKVDECIKCVCWNVIMDIDKNGNK